jgi:hypothetical protein
MARCHRCRIGISVSHNSKKEGIGPDRWHVLSHHTKVCWHNAEPRVVAVLVRAALSLPQLADSFKQCVLAQHAGVNTTTRATQQLRNVTRGVMFHDQTELSKGSMRSTPGGTKMKERTSEVQRSLHSLRRAIDYMVRNMPCTLAGMPGKFRMWHMLSCASLRGLPRLVTLRSVGLSSGLSREVRGQGSGPFWSATSYSRCIGTAPGRPPGGDADLNNIHYKRLVKLMSRTPFDAKEAKVVAIQMLLNAELAKKDAATATKVAELVAQLAEEQAKVAQEKVKVAHAKVGKANIECMKAMNLFNMRGLIGAWAVVTCHASNLMLMFLCDILSLVKFAENRWGPPARPRRTRRQRWQHIVKERHWMESNISAKLREQGLTALATSLPECPTSE